ncbi:MAG: GlcNAc-PI de-N-acetylase [Tenericutes bacterium GWC2_34_14]|nr:MAG: GlcNAc-PI de-N-acetylase [Tenericutes bacterium GWA2_35_7]OHE28708.1 MAG: GlcNAc-PI de-N-acetylase [Tenericutes bacterium GWC2_34_14]OHE33367.1 MAG: GlcNAc-PI de-N-acetylase [Tenericutes bacterium GWE2_34_108]OHE36668.1 MAG: GlcNAc-PI de-N-acetylase [Tenericutes bacterium GWF1_35_14]OHE38252.1 MAG: GlcNAc-PI de-N-acetylase [Tenericutes bacterium GWF2_35_184]OHE44959.1 MAG: GlcNAc-PI de-N-acetylase [Tenericutes bacterium RIFOXYA2_FULL_36_32]OHE45422.1 MAG: GlcNAc-PI de-N-acetylase [Ten
MKTIMAIGAHIGDMELTAGGVLASMALEGHKIITLALTSGEKGNPKDMSVEDYRIQKNREAKAFAEMLGGTSIVLPYDDGTLVHNEKIGFEVADLIREHKPDILITHWKNSMHKDHETTHKIVNDAQFYAGIKGFERKNPPHFAAGPYYAENWEDPTDFHPYVYVHVSEEGYKLWQKAISTHWFALNSTSFKYKEYYEALMIVRGKEARTLYAQAFDVSPISKRVIKTSF